MAKDKKSVLLYCDIIHTVEQLDDADAGLLFKHYLRYINDQNPEPPNKLVQIVFEPIKQNLKRDLIKWVTKSTKNSESANKRWSERNKENANACERIERNAKDADKDTVIVKVKDTVKENTVPKTELDLAFESYIEMRKKIKKPATEHAIELVKKKLDELSKCNEPLKIKILNQSIVNCWQDIYELKQSQQTGFKQPIIQQTKTYKNLD